MSTMRAFKDSFDRPCRHLISQYLSEEEIKGLLFFDIFNIFLTARYHENFQASIFSEEAAFPTVEVLDKKTRAQKVDNTFEKSSAPYKSFAAIVSSDCADIVSCYLFFKTEYIRKFYDKTKFSLENQEFILVVNTFLPLFFEEKEILITSRIKC